MDLTWWTTEKIDNEAMKNELNYFLHRGLDGDKLKGLIKSAWRHVRTRLYFTCASHIYSLYNIFCYGDLNDIFQKESVRQKFMAVKTCNYFTHFVIKLYEDLSKPVKDYTRFTIELGFCAGQDNDGENKIDH